MTRSTQVTQNIPLIDWRRRVLLLSSVLLVLAMLVAMARSPLADEGEEAVAYVQNFSDQALLTLSDESLNGEARTREFRRLLTTGFHLDRISRFVLGRHWRKADEAERAEFRLLFEDYIVASYARQFSEYRGEGLVVDGGRPKGKSGAIVASHINRPEGGTFKVEWRLHRGKEGWRIIDVVIEGVSMAVTQRSEFSSVIASRGGKLAGLLEVLRDKTSQPVNQALSDGEQAS